MSLFINGLFPGVLNPSTTVAGCVDIFENIWPDPSQTIKMAEELNADTGSEVSWQKAPTFGDGPFQNVRTNKVIPITHLAHVTDDPRLQNIHNQFRMILMAAIPSYIQRCGIREDLIHEDYQLLKYSKNEEYKQHYDGGTASGRAVSAIIYLNDDYQGGELDFPHHGIKIRPQKGMLVLFPSNFAYSHVSHPISEGIKYAIVTWLRDRSDARF